VKVAQDFIYRSDNNADWMTKDELITWVDANRYYIGKI
jgi:UDP-N-acetylglucosamine 4,6-dehydratase